MPLSDLAIKKVQPTEKKQKLFDGGGLFLEVNISGSKLWRMKYRFGGEDSCCPSYPLISLKDARDKRDDAKRLILDGQDPSEVKKAKKLTAIYGGEDSFESVSREWIDHNSAVWVENHKVRILRRLESYVFPWIGKRTIGQLTHPELLSVARELEDRGVIETTHRVMSVCGQILRSAVATGRADRDITTDLRGALKTVKEKHLASITEPKQIGRLLLAIDSYDDYPVTRYVLLLALLVFVRPVELRKAEWQGSLSLSRCPQQSKTHE